MGFKGAIFGAVSAGVANVIGGAWGASAGVGAKAGRAILHGLSRAAISRAQGGKWSAGFWSGFAGSALAPFAGRSTAGAAIVGGTASVIGGGKFANGAVSAAFVHMYNAMAHPTYPSKEHFITGFTKDVSRAYRALSMIVRSNGFAARGLPSLSYSQAYDRVLRIEAMNDTIGSVLIAGTAGLVLAPVAEAGYMYAMANPFSVMTGVGIADNLFMGGTPATNLYEQAASILHESNPWVIK